MTSADGLDLGHDHSPPDDQTSSADRSLAADDEGLRAVLALTAGGMASWRLDLATGMITGDDRLAHLFGFAPGHWPIPRGAILSCMHPADEPSVRAAIAASVESGDEYFSEFRVRRTADADPTDADAWRWLGGRGRPLPTEDGGPATGLIGINWDITDTKLAEERMVSMAVEMDHRARNVFAVMRALVNIGRRRATDLESFADDLGDQVQAMAEAHEIAASLAIAGGDPKPAVPIAKVVETVLDPTAASLPERVTLSLDPRLSIASSRVSGLTMLLHELLANAIKHGALRPRGGTLTVTIEATRLDGVESARLVWNETVTGPLSEAGPERSSGFGSVLVEHCIALLAAREERALRPEGFKMTMVLPVLTPPEGDA